MIRAGLRNPVKVSIKVESKDTKEIQKTPQQLENFYMICESDQKFPQLLDFLSKRKDKKIIIYFLTCACVDYFRMLFKSFTKLEIPIISIHGKVPHQARTKAYQKFLHLKTKGILLTTDVTARGLDMPDVDWIVQYPFQPFTIFDLNLYLI